MKCTSKRGKCDSNKFHMVKMAFTLSLVIAFLLTGCGTTGYDMPYDSNYPVSSFKLIQIDDSQTARPFAADLCIADADVTSTAVSLNDVGAAALFDLNGLNTLYAKNVNKQMHPASLTKIMTALVALKYGSLDQVLTASENVIITESGAQLCGLKPGDSMTLDQALHILLIYSANDVAVLIAEGIGGSVEDFAEMMNKEAISLGATNCNFVNPNGLTEENHYVTAYDLYLIFAEALQYDLFNEIIRMPSYSTIYKDSSGNDKSLDIKTTNAYLQERYELPERVTVIGGKTGTTRAAGHCLILLSRNSSGNPYISIILNSDSTDNLYMKMTDLLNTVP